MAILYGRVSHHQRQYKDRDMATLSQTSKMPSKSISISAFLCNNGSKFAEIEGSVCHECYARRGFYHMPSVKKAMNTRLEFMQSTTFVSEMVGMLENERLFRWFDSGDIQDEKMGHDILDVCEQTPWCQHWLPSKEYTWWSAILKVRKLPSNVALRMSTPMDDRRPISGYPCSSTTFTHEDSPANVGAVCEAHLNKEKHGEYTCGISGKHDHVCRKCWDSSVDNIAYPKRYNKKKG